MTSISDDHSGAIINVVITEWQNRKGNYNLKGNFDQNMNDLFESRITNFFVACRTQIRGASRSGRPGKLRNIAPQPAAVMECVSRLDLNHFESPRCCHCEVRPGFNQRLPKT